MKIPLVFLGGVAWANVFLSVFAQRLWAGLYEGLCEKFDLTYAQGALVIPVISATLCLLTGISSLVFFVRGIQRKKLSSKSAETFAGLLCFSAFLFYLVLNIHSAPVYKQMISIVQLEQSRSALYETGQVLDGRYVNDSYGFSLRIPSGWTKASWPMVQRKKVRVEYSMFSMGSSSGVLTNWVSRHVDGIDTLLVLLKYPNDIKIYNPSLLVSVNKKQRLFEGQGVSNLVSFAQMLATVPSPYVVDRLPAPTTIAGQKAMSLNVISVRSGFTINQKIYVCEAGDSYLEFVASTIDQSDASILLTCLNTLNFRSDSPPPVR